MDRRRPPVADYLQSKEVQERLQQKIGEVRAKSTVTISRAAELFGFSENRLRDWEKRGLLSAERAAKQDGKGPAHRQYTPADLDKLAVIQALLDGGYSLSELERAVEVIWQAAGNLADGHAQAKEERERAESLPLDRRVERMNEESAWRYIVSQALRLSLMLIREEASDTIVGLVLPLYRDLRQEPAPTPARLCDVGPALIGWLDPKLPFCTFLESTPQFEYSTDFRLHKLLVMEANVPVEDRAQDSTLIVVQRKAKPLTLTPLAVETIRGLLALVYQNIEKWKPCFDNGPRDWVYYGTNFSDNTISTDILLKSLTNTVITLGGETNGRKRWNFCCLLLPEDNTLPLQQRSLVVCAQSDTAPHTLETTVVSPGEENPGLSIKAFQSGHCFYRPEIAPDDPMIAYRTKEGPIRSAIAIPISGEGGLSAGVMYVTANEPHAFSERDQRLLRMMSRMVEELLATYTARQWFERKLTPILERPQLVDPAFEGFLSEGDFIRDLEALLEELRKKMGRWEEPVRLEPLPLPKRAARFWADERQGVVSSIAIDIDGQSGIAQKYGDETARNLCVAVGQRIKSELSSLEKYATRSVYHVNADRFYILLRGISLEEARTVGYQLKKALKRNYPIHFKFASGKQPMSPEHLIDIPDITVRVGVTAYPYAKLEELLRRYPYDEAISEVRELITTGALNAKLAREQQGDGIVTWMPESWGYDLWPPPQAKVP
jgi:DNA-binding transcriptional MerR regulator/GGDEF domain-containing protein/GAF domain-containing protein